MGTSPAIPLPTPKFVTGDFPSGVTVHIDKGAMFFCEGEEFNGYAYLIIEGEMEISILGIGDRKTLLYRLTHGDLIGEIGLFCNQHRTANVVATTRCVLWRISAKQFAKAMQRMDVMQRIMAHFFNRYVQSHQVVNRLGQPSIASKLCKYLICLPKWETVSGESLDVYLPPHSELAEMLGCMRESLSRVMGKLQQAETLIALGNGRYRLYRSQLLLWLEA